MGTTLGIRHQDKAIAKYCEEIENLYKHGQTKEGRIVPKFDELLNTCAKKVGWLLTSEYVIKRIDTWTQATDSAQTVQVGLCQSTSCSLLTRWMWYLKATTTSLPIRSWTVSFTRHCPNQATQAIR